MKEKISKLLAEVLAESEMLFLVHLSISLTNKISILIDGDNGVTINECARINQFIRSALNEEILNYSIEVSSPGLKRPLEHLRQYKKNKNRKLRVTTSYNEIFEGTLTEVSNEEIVLTRKERMPKLIGKGKRTVEKRKEIKYKEIKEAMVQIIF